MCGLDYKTSCRLLRRCVWTAKDALSFDDHINGIGRLCNFHTWALQHICSSLTHDVNNTVECNNIDSKLDYGNSLLHGASEKSLDRLHWVQNKLPHVVHNVSTCQYHSIDLLQVLHWLPICSWVIFKIGTVLQCTAASTVNLSPWRVTLICANLLTNAWKF